MANNTHQGGREQDDINTANMAQLKDFHENYKRASTAQRKGMSVVDGTEQSALDWVRLHVSSQPYCDH